MFSFKLCKQPLSPRAGRMSLPRLCLPSLKVLLRPGSFRALLSVSSQGGWRRVWQPRTHLRVPRFSKDEKLTELVHRSLRSPLCPARRGGPVWRVPRGHGGAALDSPGRANRSPGLRVSERSDWETVGHVTESPGGACVVFLCGFL